MKTSHISRRRFLNGSAALAGPVLVGAQALPAVGAQDSTRSTRPLKVLCVGAHPDDPESGCAGTLALYVEAGHAVTIVYLTRGERGIHGKSLEAAAQIRSAECEAACKIIGAKPVFFGQIDGATELNRAQVDAMSALLSGEKPDLLFTHWPVDTHMDHQVAGILAIRACMAMEVHPRLYFFEVNTGDQSRGFLPDTYVDVSRVLEKKRAALIAHASQDGVGIWRQHHEVIATWRGREAGVRAAEAFVHLNHESQFHGLPSI